MNTEQFIEAKFGFKPSTMRRFMSRLRGLDHVVRWNFYGRIKDQTVAAHTGWVCIFAHLLLTIEENWHGVDTARRAFIMSSAVAHDMEEAITGDGPFLLKKHIGHHTWDAAVFAGLMELHEGVPDGIRQKLIRWCVEAKDGEWGKFVKAADLFDVLKYAQDEAHMGNGRAFSRIGKEAIYLIRKLELPAADILLCAMGVGDEPGVPVTDNISHLGEDGACHP